MTIPMVVVCEARTGDLFRLWPDGRAVQIEEPILDRPGALCALEPSRRDTAKFHSCSPSDELWICPFERCPNCRGLGAFHNGAHDPHGFDSTFCPACEGDGGYYALAPVGAPTVLRRDLPFDPEALARFAPLRLEDEALVVVDLRRLA